MSNLSRRTILKGLGASALAAPLSQLFRMHLGRAAGATALPKVVFFYTPCGVEPNLWHPAQTGTTFTLPKLSAPLQPYASSCIFMDGVSMYPLTDHQGGSQQMLAGDDRDVTTLDLQLGNLLKNATPFGSYQLGIQSRISKGGTVTVPHPHFTRISLAQEVYAQDNPLAAFADLFGQDTMASSATGAALLAAQQKSVLDVATADLVSLQKALPPSESAKVQSYADSLRALEARLTIALPTGTACDTSKFNMGSMPLTVPPFSDPNQASYNQTATKGIVADLQMELARLALACGRTRVVTLLFEHTNAHNPTQGLGIFGVHDASHYGAPPGQLTGTATPLQMQEKLAAWENYRVWYAQKLAQFIVSMQSTPDVTGSLLDNTIILHCSELGDGAPHKTDRIPYIFIGGSALGFKLGQALNFKGAVPAYSGGAHAGIANLAHSTLLTLVANKMGLPLSGSYFGFSGTQALNPQAIGVTV